MAEPKYYRPTTPVRFYYFEQKRDIPAFVKDHSDVFGVSYVPIDRVEWSEEGYIAYVAGKVLNLSAQLLDLCVQVSKSEETEVREESQLWLAKVLASDNVTESFRSSCEYKIEDRYANAIEDIRFCSDLDIALILREALSEIKEEPRGNKSDIIHLGSKFILAIEDADYVRAAKTLEQMNTIMQEIKATLGLKV